MKFLPLEFVHIEFKIDPLGTGQTLGQSQTTSMIQKTKMKENNLKIQ